MTYKLHDKNRWTLLAVEPQLAAAGDRTLSLYLPVRAEGFESEYYKLLLNHLTARYEGRLDKKDEALLRSELGRLRTHLDLVRPAGVPAIAAFSREPARLLTLIRLPESVEARLEIGPPLLEPLELILRRHPPALVVVVDKEEARIFASVLGEVVPLEHLTGQEVRHSRGGTSAASNQRKADNRTRANLKRAVEAVEKRVEAGGFERLLVAGPEEARAGLVRALPKALAALVGGHLSASPETPPGRLMEEIREQISRTSAAPLRRLAD
jgi:hypothetical protein